MGHVKKYFEHVVTTIYVKTFCNNQYDHTENNVTIKGKLKVRKHITDLRLQNGVCAFPLTDICLYLQIFTYCFNECIYAL